MSELIPSEMIQQRILFLRGKRVLLDADLARFYRVGTRDLNKAVARNPDRFPEDFAFKLTLEETRALIFQTGISKPDEPKGKALMFQPGTSNSGDESPLGTGRPSSRSSEIPLPKLCQEEIPVAPAAGSFCLKSSFSPSRTTRIGSPSLSVPRRTASASGSSR